VADFVSRLDDRQVVELLLLVGPRLLSQPQCGSFLASLSYF
jgi:hypothetical protein